MNLEVLSRLPSGAAHPVPLLFVHGAWHGAWCWDEHFLPYFAERGFAAYALSLRNHGASAPSGSLRFSCMRDYVEDVARGAAQLPSPPVIIGHSMGGFVAQHFLARHNAPASVLVAPAPPTGVLPTTLKLARRHPLAFLKANALWSLYPFIATPALAKEAFFSADMDDALADAYWRRLQDESFMAFLDMLALDLPKPQASKSPMLVVGGGRDSIFSPAQVEATARAYGATAEIFPDVAHDMMLEAGWRDVATRIADWLTAVLPN